MYEILKEFQVLAAGIFAVVAAGIVWHRIDEKLEALKAEMKSAYSKQKFDLTLIGQAEYRAKVIQGVEELWNAILAVRDGRDHLLEDADAGNSSARSRDSERKPRDIDEICESVSQTHRVFVGDRLFQIFTAITYLYSLIQLKQTVDSVSQLKEKVDLDIDKDIYAILTSPLISSASETHGERSA